MKPSHITPLVLAKLGFPSPMDYDVKPDQSLAVIDSNGQKFVIPYKDYAALLPETHKPECAQHTSGNALRKGEGLKPAPIKKAESEWLQATSDHAQHKDAGLRTSS